MRKFYAALLRVGFFLLMRYRCSTGRPGPRGKKIGDESERVRDGFPRFPTPLGGYSRGVRGKSTRRFRSYSYEQGDPWGTLTVRYIHGDRFPDEGEYSVRGLSDRGTIVKRSPAPASGVVSGRRAEKPRRSGPSVPSLFQ